MSQAGRSYRAANGAAIPNLGETTLAFRDPEGRPCGLGFQVAQVERPLVAVSQLADSGHEVVFRQDGGHILHVASGRRLPLERSRGVYLLKMMVDEEPAADFPRPEV